MLRSRIMLAVMLLCALGCNDPVDPSEEARLEAEMRERIREADQIFADKKALEKEHRDFETHWRSVKNTRDMEKSEIAVRHELEAMARSAKTRE